MPVEVRGLWVVRSSITNVQSIRNIVAAAKSHNFNTLFVQVRGRGDAYYKSNFEPRAEELANAPADFDPLHLLSLHLLRLESLSESEHEDASIVGVRQQRCVSGVSVIQSSQMIQMRLIVDV